MISYDDAIAVILNDVKQMPSESVLLAKADDRVLAKPVKAQLDLPRFDQSAMDGIGVRKADLLKASSDSPKVLKMAGEMPAGVSRRLKLKKGCAIKVFTGSLLPSGTDTVVMKEYCEFSDGSVSVSKSPGKGDHIRKRAEEMKKGDPLISVGTKINPAVVGLLASHGLDSVSVYKQPTVTLITMGNELLQSGQRLTQGKIHDANGPSLAAALYRSGVGVVKHRYVDDNPASLKKAMKLAMGNSDVVITVGGASVGDHDHVIGVRESLKVKERFARVAIKPGKPNIFGVAPGGALMFGLPGNPVSALVSFLIFVVPALRKLGGMSAQSEIAMTAVLDAPVTKKPGRLEWVRGKIRTDDNELYVTPTRGQGSHMLSGLASADVLLEFPTGVSKLSAGERVRIHPIGW